MANSLFNQLGSMNQYADLIRQFNQFKKTFSGDPRQQIQQMLDSGRITQQQYNDAVQKAQAFAQILNMK